MEEAIPVVDKTDGEDDINRRTSSMRSSVRKKNSVANLEPLMKDDKGDVVEKTCGTRFCEVMKKQQIPIVLLAAAIGIGAGIGLAMWEDDTGTKDTVLLWVELLGDLFLRGLRCVVLPLIFVSIAVSVMDMLSLGEAGSIVGTTIGLYMVRFG